MQYLALLHYILTHNNQAGMCDNRPKLDVLNERKLKPYPQHPDIYVCGKTRIVLAIAALMII
ncbi:MAG: hypothetical protein V7L29_29945 [Nostoc sp.]|uniref:hypothetical protein n=1 Tax=Nostoc sp. TaxID=1180 RepID=UPI002FF0A934